MGKYIIAQTGVGETSSSIYNESASREIKPYAGGPPPVALKRSVVAAERKEDDEEGRLVVMAVQEGRGWASDHVERIQ